MTPHAVQKNTLADDESKITNTLVQNFVVRVMRVFCIHKNIPSMTTSRYLNEMILKYEKD